MTSGTHQVGSLFPFLSFRCPLFAVRACVLVRSSARLCVPACVRMCESPTSIPGLRCNGGGPARCLLSRSAANMSCSLPVARPTCTHGEQQCDGCFYFVLFLRLCREKEISHISRRDLYAARFLPPPHTHVAWHLFLTSPSMWLSPLISCNRWQAVNICICHFFDAHDMRVFLEPCALEVKCKTSN